MLQRACVGELRSTIQEAFITMPNQYSYAHEKFCGNIKGSFKNKKFNKSSMLLIMVGDMASIFTKVYITKATPIYSFFPHLLHTVPFTSLPFFESMWTFLLLFSFAAVTGPMYSWLLPSFF